MNFKEILISAWIWFFALATAYGTDSETFRVCNSTECMERAKLINESLNASADPCQDFYSYVCSRWESSHQSEITTGHYDVNQEIGKGIPEKLSYVLGNRSLVECNQTIIDKVTATYKACLGLPDSHGALIKVLNKSGFNSWPILTEHNNFNWSNCTDLLRHMGMSEILHVHNVYSDGDNIPRLEATPVLKKIRNMPNITAVINSTIRLLNPGLNISMLGNLTEQLAKLSDNLSKKAGLGGYKTYQIRDLEAAYANIPISDLLERELRKVNVTLNDTDTLKVFYFYYSDLNEILATADPNTLYNYAGFLSLFPYIEYVEMNISNELLPSTTKGRNWSECIALLDETTPDILDYLYITNYTNPVIKAEVEDIASKLRQALNETFQNITWMHNTTREAVEKKLEEVTLTIGYPETLHNISVLESRYKYVPFFPLNISFIEAFYRLREGLYKMHLSKLWHQETSNLGREYSPRNLMPYYDYSGNRIEIPYALFVPPFYQQGLPWSLNYGGIGGTIAHELAYKFLTDNRRNWTAEDRALFENLTSCFEKQYKPVNRKLLLELDDNYNDSTSAEATQYEAFFKNSSEHNKCRREYSSEYYAKNKSIPSGNNHSTDYDCLRYWEEYHIKRERYQSKQLRIRWSRTLNEDIADNIGLQTAFKAYNQLLQGECEGIDTRLRGLENVTGLQLFFISTARTQCRIADNATLIKELRRGKYSAAPNRVNLAMKNFKEFARAFNCSCGSHLYPPRNETCSLW